MEVNASEWDNTLEPASNGRLALRLGFGRWKGFASSGRRRLSLPAPRAPSPAWRTSPAGAHLPRAGLRLLADADALRSLGLERRDALWRCGARRRGELPLFAAARAGELKAERDLPLPAMSAAEQVAVDYQTTASP